MYLTGAESKFGITVQGCTCYLLSFTGLYRGGVKCGQGRELPAFPPSPKKLQTELIYYDFFEINLQ
jgi:hypothetical protein